MSPDEVVTQDASAEHELLLRAVLLDGRDASDAFAQWRGAVDVETVDGPSQRLLPLLARRHADLAPDDPLRRRVQGIYRHAWAKNHRLWLAAAPVVGAFEDRGIPTILLKGMALLPAYGDDWGARPMYDVDVLVPAARAAEALDVLAAAAWEPEQEVSASWIRWRALASHHSWGFVAGEGRLDLHWHVLPDSVGAHADDAFWRHRHALVVEDATAHVLDPADLLAHVLLHGNTALNRPLLQWIVDAVMVMRWAGGDDLYDRFAATVRAHGEVATSIDALERIGAVVGRGLVDVPLARLRTARPNVVERLRLAGARSEPVRQVARHVAGDVGLVRGAEGLVADRLDLALTTHRGAAITYAVARRSSLVARVWRRRVGSFARTAVEPPTVGRGDVLDFGDPATLDRHGSVGWGRTDDGGATTKGGEPRLVLPLDPSLDGCDVVVTLELEARGGDAVVETRANERLIGVWDVSVDGTTVSLHVPAGIAHGLSPLELTLRTASTRLGRRPSARLRLRSVTIDRWPAAAGRPTGGARAR